MGYEFFLHRNIKSTPEFEVDHPALSMYRLAFNADPRYLALNIDAMADIRDLMWEREMLNDCKRLPPEPEDIGLQRIGPHPCSVFRDDPPYCNFDDAHWDWLAFECDMPGIPAQKLMSNDMWLITPGQIFSALEQGERFPPPEYEIWDTWIRFLKRGAASGGISVW